MKTINFKTLVMATALPILGSFLFLACGGESSGPTKINTQTLPPLGSFELVSPSAGSTICTYPQFKVHFKSNDYCSARDLSDTIGVIPQGQNSSVGVTIALPARTADGGCDFTFYPRAALPTAAIVQWGVFQASASSSSSLLSNFATFTTSNSAACPGDQARFVMSNVFGGGTQPYPLGDVGSFGTLNPDGTFNANFNLDAAYQNALTPTYLAALSALLGTSVSANQDFTIKFNEAPLAISVPGSIQVAQSGLTSLSLSTPISNVGVAVSSSDPTMVVIRHPAEGWSEGVFTVVVNKSIISASGRPLGQIGASGPSSYMFVFKSSGI